MFPFPPNIKLNVKKIIRRMCHPLVSSLDKSLINVLINVANTSEEERYLATILYMACRFCYLT